MINLRYYKIALVLCFGFFILNIACLAKINTKILAIIVSPRKNGNSETLLKSFLKGVKENSVDIEAIRISTLNIPPWTNPNYKSTAFSSSDEKMIYDKIRKADIIVIASPIYFTSLPAQMKALIDQAQPIWRKQIFSKINCQTTIIFTHQRQLKIPIETAKKITCFDLLF